MIEYYVVGAGIIPASLYFSGTVTQFPDLAAAIAALPAPAVPGITNVIFLTDLWFDAFGKTYLIDNGKRVTITGRPDAADSPMPIVGVGTGPGPLTTFLVENAHVTFQNLMFMVVPPVSASTNAVLFSDGDPGGAVTLGVAVHARGSASYTLAFCYDVNLGAGAITVFSAFAVRRPLGQPSVVVLGHRTLEGMQPVADGTGTTFAVQAGRLQVISCALIAAPTAITVLDQCDARIEGSIFRGADAESAFEPRHGILYRSTPGWPAIGLSASLVVRTSVFVECFRGVEVRSTELIASLVTIRCEIVRCYFEGYPEGLQTEGSEQHLIGVFWKFQNAVQSPVRRLLVENCIFRALSEAVGVTGWWWSTILIGNNTVVYPRFACIFLDDPNRPPVDQFGVPAESTKDLIVANNLFQAAFPTFVNAGAAPLYQFPRAGIYTIGPNPDTWAAGTGTGSLVVASNYFANIPPDVRMADIPTGDDLRSFYFPPNPPTQNLAASPADGVLTGAPFVTPTPDYSPRWPPGVFPSPINTADGTFLIPPPTDFFGAGRIGGADSGAVEQRIGFEPANPGDGGPVVGPTPGSFSPRNRD